MVHTQFCHTTLTRKDRAQAVFSELILDNGSFIGWSSLLAETRDFLRHLNGVDHDAPEKNRRRVRNLAAATCIASAFGITSLFAPPGYAADPTGLVTSFGPEAGAVLGSELITWQGEILVNKTTAGFTAFQPATGSGAPSPIATTNMVKTSTVFSGLLAWIDGIANTVRTANPGGTVTALACAIPPTSDKLVGVGVQLWIARTGGVDRYT